MFRFGAFVFLAIAAGVSAQSAWSDNLILGQVTRDSVLLYSGSISGSDFEWRGANAISAIHINATRSNSLALRNLQIRGGLRSDYLQFWSNTGPFDVTVQLYSQPLSATFGWNNGQLSVIRETIVDGTAPLRVDLNTNVPIQVTEVTDLTNGTGAYVLACCGSVSNSLDLQIASHLFRGRVKLRVRVYGEIPKPRDYQTGEMHAQSKLIATEQISVSNTMFGHFEFHSPNHTIDFASFTDLTNGTGGSVQLAHIQDSRLTAFLDVQPRLAFRLDVYGREIIRPSTNDIIVGAEHHDQFLVDSRVVYEYSKTREVLVNSPYPISRIEVRNRNPGDGAKPTLQAGEVGGNYVLVLIEAPEFQLLQFEVNVFARRCLHACI